MSTLYLIFLHFLADFILQDREMGNKKSTEFGVLSAHISIVYIVFAIGMYPFYSPVDSLLFGFTNMVVHGIIDWNIWKIYKSIAHKRIIASIDSRLPDERYQQEYTYRVVNFAYWDDYWFWVTVGLDQFLHLATLILLKEWLL